MLLLLLFLSIPATLASTSSKDSTSVEVKIAKCCEINEFLLDGTCTPSPGNTSSSWKPEFVHEDDARGRSNPEPKYHLVFGLPRCEGNEHQNHVYYYPSSPDRLGFLPSGHLRHYIENLEARREQLAHYDEDYFRFEEGEPGSREIFYDYEVGRYCADQIFLSRDRIEATYASICVPKVVVKWSDTSYLIRHGLVPTLYAISAVCYLVVAVVYFVLPQLRDLVGNIITSLSLCFIFHQCASLVKTFTEHGNHVNFLLADAVLYTSLLGAFFWLNALGYYIWHTFRSRNIFLRLTDGRKFCYYSSYVVLFTASIAATAIFAHFTLETSKPMIGGTTYPSQELMGWLGMSVIFTTIAFTIIIDLCFVFSTTKTIRKMNTYGRIHYKFKYNLRIFVLLFAIMSTSWIFLLLAQTEYEGLVFCHVAVNVIDAMLILYVCVFGQKRVMFLLGKTCNCCASNENVEGLDWGEEMTAINAGY